MNIRLVFLFLIASIIAVSCEQDPILQDNTITFPETPSLDTQLDSVLNVLGGSEAKNFFIQPESHQYHLIPQDPLNPITTAKVDLGKLLFHEPGIATDPFEPEGLHTYSCASCHHAKAGFQAGVAQGIGEGGEGYGEAGEGRFRNKFYTDDLQIDVQPIRTPSVLGIAYQEVMLWGGRMGGTGINSEYSDLWAWTTAPEHFNTFGLSGVETQAVGGLQIHRMEIDTEFVNNTNYRALFDAAFPDFIPKDRYEKYTAGLAIAAYQRTLLANQSPWQAYLKGQTNALSKQQKLGAMLFFGKANCVSCHTGPALNSMSFHAVGMNDLSELGIIASQPPNDANMNLGRGDFTQNPSEYYQFKVPQLYNLKDSPFYGHGASFNSIRDVIVYFNEAVPENGAVPLSNISPEFVPLNLSEEEIDQLTDFLENALRDPNLKRYEPDVLPSGFCFPNNDPISQEDLGCS